MKHLLFCLLSFILVLCSCKTQTAVAPINLKDSVSITYKQGKEQPTPTGVIGAAHSSICVIDEGLPEIATGATSSELATTASPSSPPQGEGVKSKSVGHLFKSAGDLIPRNLRNSEASGRLIIRVDTVFVERWHTQILQPEGRSYSESGPSGEAGLSAKRSQFYKCCTWGFFILILLLLGRIAFRIIKAIYLRK